MKTKTKKIISAVGAAIMLASYAPMSMASTNSASDYYARNFLATDNAVYWNRCAQISWFNPSVQAEKISLYAQGPEQKNGSWALLGDDYDTTPNASVVTTFNSGNWAVTPRDAWYTFKLVAEFADGTTKEQTLDFYVPNNDKTLYLNNGVWNLKTDVSEDFRTGAQRGGDNYGNTQGGGDFFPMSTELVYDNGNPALRVWSNAHISSGEDATGLNGEYNSGNYFGDFFLTKSIEEGEAYEISFRYKAKGIENVVLHINNKEQNTTIIDTNGEWQTFTATVDAAVGTVGSSLLDFELKVGNEELIIDDVVIKKAGTNENILTDGDFSKLAASAPANVTDAVKTVSGNNVTLKWKDSANAKGVNVYKQEADGSQVRVAYVRNTIETLSLASGDGAYIAKAVNDKGAESAGVTFELPSYRNDQIAALDFAAYDMHIWGNILIAWKNADVGDITSVELFDSTGAKIGDFSTEANAFCNKIVTGIDENQFYTYKLVTKTASGDCVEQYATGVETPTGDLDALGWGYVDWMTDKFKVFRQQGRTEIAPVHPEVVIENDNSYFKLQNAYGAEGITQGFTSLHIPADSANLKAGETYTVTYKIKGAIHSWAKLWAGDNHIDINGGSIATYKDWTEKSVTITEPSTAQDIRFVIQNNQNGIPTCLDDIVVKNSAGKTVYSENFEEEVVSFGGQPITNITAVADGTTVDLSWTAPGMDDGAVKYVRVYATTAKGSYLAATLDPVETSFTLNDLDPDTDYTFEFEIITASGAKSSKYSTTVKTVLPDYKVKSVKLLNYENVLTTGTYTAQAVVANNKLDNFGCQVIAALYDNGVFVSAVKSDVKTISKGGSETVTAPDITVPETTGHNYSVSVFVWDSLDGMKPLYTSTDF